MPSLVARFGLAAELVLLFSGLVLLWRLRLSPTARAARPAPRLTAWEIAPLHFALCLWCVITGGLVAQLAAGLSMRLVTLDSDARLILASAAFQFGMLAGGVGFALWPPARRHFARPHRPFLRAGFGTFLIALPLLFGLGAAWAQLLNAIGLPAEHQPLIDQFTHSRSPLQLGTLVALAVLVAPVTEELVFRAVLFRFLHTRLPRWAALLLPAVLFGALHANLASFPQLVALGVIFSLAYERTGNIAVPMLAHALFNLNTILLLLAGIET